MLRLGDLAYPIAPGTGTGDRREVHDRQHYRLIGWRNGICGYRRFFSITSLAGLRQEDRAVFEATHAEVRPLGRRRVWSTACASTIPTACPIRPAIWRGCAELIGDDAWIVIEKILAVDEPLDTDLPVAGTTGYDALREVGGVFLDPAGERAADRPLRVHRCRLRVDPGGGSQAQGEAVTDTLGSELARLRRTVVGATGADHPQLPDAVAALLEPHRRVPVRLPVAVAGAARRLRGDRRRRPELAEPLAILSSAALTHEP